MDFERVVGRQKKDDLLKRGMTSIKVSVWDMKKPVCTYLLVSDIGLVFLSSSRQDLVNGVEERFFGLLDLQLIG